MRDRANGSSDKIRILQINVDDMGHGGVFSLVMNIFQNINFNIVFDICSVEPFQNHSNINRINKLGGEVYYVGYKGNKLLRQFVNFKQLYEFLVKSDYSTVHIHSDASFKLFSYSFAAKLAGVQNIIVHSHSTGVYGTYRRVKLLGHKLFRHLLPLTANHFFACSDLAAKWMFPDKIIKLNKVRIINNGVDLNKYRYREYIRKKYRKDMALDDKFVIGHIGRFDYPKNHDFLIEIFAECYKCNNDAVLLLIGEGELKSHIIDKVERLGLSNSVIFYGTSNEVFNLLQVMDVFLLPSRFEGLPIVGVEAQATGLPVVLSDSITKEIRLIESVEHISLNESPMTWAKRVLSYQDFHRIDTKRALQKTGFDIRTTVEYLERFYTDLYSV